VLIWTAKPTRNWRYFVLLILMQQFPRQRSEARATNLSDIFGKAGGVAIVAGAAHGCRCSKGASSVDEASGIWQVSFMHYEIGYFDLETCRLEPVQNPFGAKVLTMSAV
jgi:hypothetical protein